MPNRHRVVIVGLGRMGRNHLRILQNNSRVEIVGIVDSLFENNSIKFGSELAIQCFSSIDEIHSLDIDAFIVATPTQTHFEVVKKLVCFKKPILVEKPICSTEDEGCKLLSLCRDAGILLFVGHVERQNPAIKKLQEVVHSGIIGTPIHCSITRVGGYPEQVQEGNNVLLDLAVHDLDLLQLFFGDFEFLSSIVHNTTKNGTYDTAQILGVCKSGVSADIHVNWVTPTKIRTLRLTGTFGVCLIDYMLQTCCVLGGNMLKHRPNSNFSYQDLITLYASSDRIEFGVTRKEPLTVQLEQYLDAIEGKSHTLCSAEEAISVVRIAEQSLHESRKMTVCN